MTKYQTATNLQATRQEFERHLIDADIVLKSRLTTKIVDIINERFNQDLNLLLTATSKKAMHIFILFDADGKSMLHVGRARRLAQILINDMICDDKIIPEEWHQNTIS